MCAINAIIGICTRNEQSFCLGHPILQSPAIEKDFYASRKILKTLQYDKN